MWADGPDHLDHDQVIDFVGGLLPGERRAGVLSHASRCGRCERLLQSALTVRERARASKQAWIAIDTATARSALAATALASRSRAEPGASWRGIAERWLAPRGAGALVAAGALAALIGVLVLPGLAQRRALVHVHWLPGSEAEVTTRDLSASLPDSLIRVGLEAYARHDLGAARQRLEAAHGRGQLELVRRIYLANIMARQGDHQEAIALLESVPFRLVPEPWSSESRWTLAASLRASGDQHRADSLVEAISQEPGPVGDRARALLHRR
jgi:hypothetical protein